MIKGGHIVLIEHPLKNLKTGQIEITLWKSLLKETSPFGTMVEMVGPQLRGNMTGPSAI